MNIYKKIIEYIKEPSKLIVLLGMHKVGRILPDSSYIKCLYKTRTGKKLNLKNPTSFNEKLQWLKLHDHKEKYIQMVDKYEAKLYVAKIIGEQYIIPTIGIWKRFTI
jgi:hypothetical protein